MSTVEEVYEGEITRKVTRRTSFKIEETSSSTKTSTMTTAAKLYGKGLDEYEEMDVDQLLSQLTAEEISMLVKDVDPDDDLLPPSQRNSYECTKQPTGPLDRKKLIEHINKQAMETPDKPELKPYVPGTVRGKKWIPPPPPQKQREAEEQIAIDMGDEYEQALNDATQEEIIDLAAILGFHSMMNQDQYHASLLNKGQPVGMGWDGITKATQPKAYPQEPPNDTDVDKTLQQVKDDDHEMLTLNWNNIRNISDEKFNDLFRALRENTHLETLSLTNVGLVDRHAVQLIEALEKNSTLKVLNVETNFLSPQIILKLIKALLVQKSLEEFRGANQRCHVLGNKIEMEITNLIEQNPTILRLGLHLEYNDARQRVATHLQRNIDRNHNEHHELRKLTFAKGNRPLDHRVHKDCYDHADEFYAQLKEEEELREHERLFPTDAPIKPREHTIVEHPTNMKPPSPLLGEAEPRNEPDQAFQPVVERGSQSDLEQDSQPDLEVDSHPDSEEDSEPQPESQADE